MAVPAPSVGQKLSDDFHNERSAETLEKVPAQRELEVFAAGAMIANASSSKASKSGNMGKSVHQRVLQRVHQRVLPRVLPRVHQRVHQRVLQR
eukprot:scaffold306778_cov51-Attheya_sp.AAC.2